MNQIMVEPTERAQVRRMIRSTFRNFDDVMNLNPLRVRTPHSVCLHENASSAASTIHRMSLFGCERFARVRLIVFFARAKLLGLFLGCRSLRLSSWVISIEPLV